MIAETDITISPQSVSIKGLANAITLPQENHYQDMTD